MMGFDHGIPLAEKQGNTPKSADTNQNIDDSTY